MDSFESYREPAEEQTLLYARTQFILQSNMLIWLGQVGSIRT